MLNYHLAIPSHRRAKTLILKTLSFLRATDAPQPTIYVVDQKDVDDYKALDPTLTLVIAPKGIAATRNYIQETQPIDSKIVFIDDDIKAVWRLLEDKKKERVRNFDQLVKEGFYWAEKLETNLWGTYPVDNNLFMKRRVRSNLCYINGSLFGVINKRVSVLHDYAEDFERTLRHYEMDKKVCRLEYIGLQTRYYKEPGGLQETRTEAKNRGSKEEVQKLFPELCIVKDKKGRADIFFIKQKAELHQI
jgi:hypothetical protein